MLKAILISIGFIVCGAAVGPVDHTPHGVVRIVHNQAILKKIDFTVITNSYALTHEVARKVDRMVKEITKKWLPEKIPVGMRHITIHVYIRSHNRAWCTITDHPRIYIYSNRELLDDTLKHELTHALLMIRYPDLPRWTHEGIASTWDGSGHQEMYCNILAWSRLSGTYPKLAEIMRGVRFTNYNTTAYTASNSLVKFLLQRNDRYTLYMYSMGRISIERAYGFNSVYELQRAWVKWLNAPVEAIKPYRSAVAVKPC